MSEEARWNEKYRGRDTPWDTGQPSTELIQVVRDEKIAPGRAIELGCGTGTNAIWLAEQGFEITAVDISPLALERAKIRAEAAGVRIQFYLADVLNPPSLGGPRRCPRMGTTPTKTRTIMACASSS
jgi:2-polyprenyl-3-methyl-5-hydroxy-6-metoxy-1,4-benzoquinol methylase